jgi:hypothetical protein
MVLKSYNAQQNLGVSETFRAAAPAEINPKVDRHAESFETESKAVGDGRDMADVTLVPRDVTH